MPDGGGQTRLYRLESVLGFPGQTEARDAEFQVLAFSLEDQLGAGYRVRARVKIPSQEFASPYDSTAPYRVKDAQFTMRRHYPDGSTMENKIMGVIRAVKRITVPAPMPLDEYDVEVVPALAMLAEHQKGQVWHGKSYLDVLQEVLEEGLGMYGRSIDNRVQGEFPEVDLVVRRPEENAFAFVQKLCHRTGINFFFTHDGQTETMVLADDNDGFEDGNQRYPGEPIAMGWSDAERSNREEKLTRAERTLRTRPKKRTLRAFDFKLPQQTAQGQAEGDGGHDAEVITWFNSRVNENEDANEQLARDAQIVGDLQANAHNAVEIASDFSGFMAGRKYPLTLHGSDQREYVIQKIRAQGTNMEFEKGGDYSNIATVVPTTDDSGIQVAVRSLAAPPAPPAQNTQYRATVQAVENGPTDVDASMRTPIKFDWDTNDEQPTTHVSIVQPFAGSQGGFQYIPREGDRVLVSFLGENGESPFIVGSVFDEQQTPPPMGPPPTQNDQRNVIRDQVVLPESRHWVGWNEQSIGDPSRQSMFQMLTTAGEELVLINAPHDYRCDAMHDSDVKTKNNGYHWVGNVFEEKIGFGGAGDYVQKIENDRTEEVGNDYALKVEGGRTAKVEKNDALEVTKRRQVTVHEGMFFEVHDKFDKRVHGDDVTNCYGGGFLVGADELIHLQAPVIKLVGGGAGVSGGLGSPAGGLAIDAAARLHHENGVEVASGPATMNASPERVRLRAPAIESQDGAGATASLEGGRYTVDAPQGIRFRCGTNEIHLSPEGIYINGQQLTITNRRTQLHTGAFDIVGPQD